LEAKVVMRWYHSQSRNLEWLAQTWR